MKITKELLERLMEISKEAYPREIGGILLKKKEVISDFVIVPGQFETHSIYVRYDQLPIYPNSAGTFHSHPSNNPNPSKADLDFFSRLGKTHMIIAHPYSLNSIGVYDSSGKASRLDVV